LGYFFVGWILLGFATTGLFSLGAGGLAGPLTGVLAALGIVWLVRSYRRGPGATLARGLQDEVDRLAGRLPADPLSSAAIVGAWGVHIGDHEAGGRLADEYHAARRTVDEVQRELDHARQAGVVRRREVLEAKLAQVHDYVRSIDLLAAAEPDLVDQAIAEHADAAATIDAARRTGADVAQLVAADARLQGAREALRRDEERPIDAIRLAEEAERIAGAAARRTALPSGASSCRERLSVAEEELAAALARHAPSALAEIRGLPALALEQLERAEGGDEAGLVAARATVHRIESHLAALERAAATARPTLEAAEQAVDAAVAGGGSGAARAADLTTQARVLLREERPDWLEISALAERALLLLDEQRSPAEHVATPSAARARAARDEVWSWALTSAPGATDARAVAERIDELLDDAARLELEGDAAGAADAYVRVVALAEPAVESASEPRARRAG
jgi:hypothetical protein